MTEEQKERIRKNKERALELRKKRNQLSSSPAGGTKSPGSEKRQKREEEEEEVDLEEFEVGASEFVTKTDAMKIYCLPEGTLAVCQFVERENPKRKGWKPMKLYYRSEIRKRARERHGGIAGLVAERKSRAEKRFQKDMEQAKDVFR